MFFPVLSINVDLIKSVLCDCLSVLERTQRRISIRCIGRVPFFVKELLRHSVSYIYESKSSILVCVKSPPTCFKYKVYCHVLSR